MKSYIILLMFLFSLNSFSINNDHEKDTQKVTGSIDGKLYNKLYGMEGYICNCYSENCIFKLIPFPLPDAPYNMSCPDYDIPLEDLAFTEDNIKSYNINSREIVFLDFFPDFEKGGISIYLNGEPILETIFLRSGEQWGFTYPDVVLHYRYGSFYFCDEYPCGYDPEDRENWISQRNANIEKRKAGWDTFIQHLRNAGKIIGENTNVESIMPPELNNIEIYPNPTTGELRIRKQRSALANYETTFGVSPLGIEGVEIYDIMGKKHPTVNYQLSTVNSIDISQLPAGIYFVRITTEKGVVTKKVVKK